MALIECVPNFSEGRRPEVIAAVVAAIEATGVTLLDVSSDVDHNRTVVTFVGDAESILEGAYAGIQTAAARIDLSGHSGEHPRIGAADVVPLIPLRDSSLEECARLARTLGQRVGAELGLPVYLYESAALIPERAALPYVRRDPYERLLETIQTDPTRAPDFGPHMLGTAGAVAIGARNPLVAFNVFLNTTDVSIAHAIAVAIRESGGGLPRLRALGLFVAGQAQVSMNIVDFRVTGLWDALQAVRAQAELHGVQVTHTEIVGLIPQTALVQAALASLQLPAHAADLILETRIGQHSGDYRPLIFE